MSGLSWRERMRRMNQRSLFRPAATPGELAGASDDAPPLTTVRAEAMQRLQVGVFGVGAMVLLVGLASIIGGQAERNDKLAVPEAAPTTEPSAAPAQANPLADAGVVPDIAAQPSPSPSVKPLDLPPPGQRAPGNAAPSQ
ncbi:hypothetical protein [Porphyrobacter sp. AAP82]|uniref:hypothetical protein n=1 Tax=Porphyrobacter sp. AAP82 TaxID=1248917 RepID=UPI0002E26C4B|nr:hypothetical protein [Porphyrobacter sp. AAP82]